MKAKVAERGQVTIPNAIRTKLGIKPGTMLDFQIKGNTLTVEKLQETDPVSKVFGCLQLDMTTDEFMDELRGKSK